MIPCSYLRLVDGQASPKIAGERESWAGAAQAAFAPPVPSLPQTQDEWADYLRRAKCPDCAIVRDQMRWWRMTAVYLAFAILIAWAIHAGVIQ